MTISVNYYINFYRERINEEGSRASHVSLLLSNSAIFKVDIAQFCQLQY